MNLDRRSKCEVTIIGGRQHITYWTGETIYGDDIYADELHSSANRGIIPKLIVDSWQRALRARYQLQLICVEFAKYFGTL